MKYEFVGRIHHEAQSVGGYDVYQSLMLQKIWEKIVVVRAYRCGKALLQGETGLKLDKLDIDAVVPAYDGVLVPPLHLFACNLICTDVLLRYGARTDIRFEGRLPLDMAMDPLERATKEVDKVIYCYVKEGKVIELAALLTVAPEEVTSPSLFKGLCDPALNGSMSLRQLVLSEIVSLMASQITLVSTSELNNKLETMMSMLRMVQVFERVGDKIELYRRYIYEFFEEFWAAQMACMLISEGLAEYEDFGLKCDDGSVSAGIVLDFNKQFFSEIFEWNLYEGMQLKGGTTKMYKHDVDPMWIPRLPKQSPTLEAIPIRNNEDDVKGSSPLKVSLEKLCDHPYLNDWTHKKSIFKLVCILCLPQLKESLESIRLVACKTEIETIGCDLARQGKLVELASLLMVAPEKLIITTSPGSSDLHSNVIRRCILSDLQASLDAEVRLMGRSNNRNLVEKFKDENEMKLSALLVLEVFERAGNSINQYLQSVTYNDRRRSRLEIVREIQNLLEKAGFAMKPRDTDLNDIKWYGSGQLVMQLGW
ncbi:hypothetical protein V6N11_024458 [Hibiscus sabdariffa]|uniref:Uncharacterized protein n=1 Tax=Hibiscus sabdariffa TaxID=183260 RepID=A0ABR2QMF7_9ROSI